MLVRSPYAVWPWLRTVVLAGSLGLCGCLRFAYDAHTRAESPGQDAGANTDGAGSSSADAGASRDSGQAFGGGGGVGAGAGGSSGVDAAGGGDASVRADASVGMDAAVGTVAGGSGGTSGAGTSDAAVADASASDAAMGDAAITDAGGARASCALAGFCDEFETGNLGNWTYPKLGANCVVEVTSTRARAGLFAMHARTNAAAADSEACWAADILGERSSGDIWLRYYYFLPSTVQITTYFSAGVMSAIVPPFDGFSMLVHPGELQIESMSGNFSQPVGQKTPFPRDRWVCVEHHVFIDKTLGEFEVYIDGVLAVSSGVTDTAASGGYRVMEMGVHYADPGQGPVEVWADDVLVDTQRMPCD